MFATVLQAKVATSGFVDSRPTKGVEESLCCQATRAKMEKNRLLRNIGIDAVVVQEPPRLDSFNQTVWFLPRPVN